MATAVERHIGLLDAAMKGQSMHAGILHVHGNAGWCLCESPLLGGLNRWVSTSLSRRSIPRGAEGVAAGVVGSGGTGIDAGPRACNAGRC